MMGRGSPVFIHDILDHFLSGFGVSGHRSEAMALIQLSKRTGSDYEQLVTEDILNGRVNGEVLQSLLGVIDQIVEELGAEEVHGVISINNRFVTYAMSENSLIGSIEGCKVAVA